MSNKRILSDKERKELKKKKINKTLSVVFKVKFKSNSKKATHLQSEPVSSSVKALPESAILMKIMIVLPSSQEKLLKSLEPKQIKPKISTKISSANP